MNGRRWLLAGLVSTSVLLSACLSGETRHDLYLDPDGSVTWTVTEREMRSNAATEQQRDQEGGAYLDAVLEGEHSVARALRYLGALRVSTALVRDEPPYMVVTQGRFRGIDEALDRLLGGLGIEHEIELGWSADGTACLEMEIDVAATETRGDETEEAVLPLADDLSSYRLVLTSGAFVEAEGFVLERDNTVARMVAPDQGVARYRLSWNR